MIYRIDQTYIDSNGKKCIGDFAFCETLLGAVSLIAEAIREDIISAVIVNNITGETLMTHTLTPSIEQNTKSYSENVNMNNTNQEKQDASIIESAENFIKHMKTKGQFSYISCADGVEQNIKFAHIMEESENRKEFIDAMFELYSGFSNESLAYKDGGKNMIKFIDAIDDIVTEHAAFAAQDEHGLIC